MSALTVKELMNELGRVQSDRVVVLRIQDDAKQTHGGPTCGAAGLFTVIDDHALILKNAHPVDGADRDVLEIGLVASSPR